MKKTFILALFFSLTMGIGFAQETATPAATPASEGPAKAVGEFGWLEETHNFGQIPQGTPVTHRFEFTNVGKGELTVSNVKKSCGCTITDWSRETVAPEGSGFVEATYNAARPGKFTKTVTVNSDAKTPVKVLYFKGEVIAKPTPVATPTATPAKTPTATPAKIPAATPAKAPAATK